MLMSFSATETRFGLVSLRQQQETVQYKHVRLTNFTSYFRALLQAQAQALQNSTNRYKTVYY